jgi:hypothetical protein
MQPKGTYVQEQDEDQLLLSPADVRRIADVAQQNLNPRINPVRAANTHDAIKILKTLSLHNEKDLHDIVGACNLYIQSDRQERSNSGKNTEPRKIEMIKKQAEISIEQLAHLSPNTDSDELHPQWDKVLIDAIQKLDQRPSALRSDHTYFTGEYTHLFHRYDSLRKGVVRLTPKRFIKLMELIQTRLTPDLKRKFTIFCLDPSEFGLKEHRKITYEEVLGWIFEISQNDRIVDIKEILNNPLIH